MGTLYLVATPIGNLEDITARALRTLREVALIAAEDTRRTSRLLAHYAIATPTTSLHEHNEQQKSGQLIERLLRGDSVAVVSDAGTPMISDPGAGLVRAAIEAGVRVEPVPGPSAVTAVLSAAGFSSDRGFTFLGFPPTRSKDRTAWFARLQGCQGSIAIFFEAPHRILATLSELRSVLAPETPVAIARELTKAHEEWVRGPISQVVSQLKVTKGEFAVAINLVDQQNTACAAGVGPIDWLREIGELTINGGVTRRQAINVLAKRTGIPPNEVYAAVERAKKIGHVTEE